MTTAPAIRITVSLAVNGVGRYGYMVSLDASGAAGSGTSPEIAAREAVTAAMELLRWRQTKP